ncbi:hypothetical protein DFH09DRAFT_1324078 [Mycena vulgaris]|nr:hypothetical protein DFH09DRAFT_1324078 [Mycena vulgaris]
MSEEANLKCDPHELAHNMRLPYGATLPDASLTFQYTFFSTLEITQAFSRERECEEEDATRAHRKKEGGHREEEEIQPPPKKRGRKRKADEQLVPEDRLSWLAHPLPPAPRPRTRRCLDVMLPSASLRLLPPGLLPSPAGTLCSPGFPAHAQLYKLRGPPLKPTPFTLMGTILTSRGRGFLASSRPLPSGIVDSARANPFPYQQPQLPSLLLAAHTLGSRTPPLLCPHVSSAAPTAVRASGCTSAPRAAGHSSRPSLPPRCTISRATHVPRPRTCPAPGS